MEFNMVCQKRECSSSPSSAAKVSCSRSWISREDLEWVLSWFQSAASKLSLRKSQWRTGINSCLQARVLQVSATCSGVWWCSLKLTLKGFKNFHSWRLPKVDITEKPSSKDWCKSFKRSIKEREWQPLVPRSKEIFLKRQLVNGVRRVKPSKTSRCMAKDQRDKLSLIKTTKLSEIRNNFAYI